MTARHPRYAVVAIAMHWLIAAAIILQVSLAGRMEGPPTPASFAVTQLHKSVGITILLVSLARLAWRLLNPPPPLPDSMPVWEKRLSGLVHLGFYGLMIGMPLTGWVMVSASKLAFPTLLYGAVPWPDVPGLAQLAPAAKATWHDAAKFGHDALAKLIYVLLALHVAGVLKHQLFSRDEPVLARMAPGARPGRWLEPRLFIIALSLVAVFAFGRWVQVKPPGLAPPAPAVAPVEPPPAIAASAPVATAPQAGGSGEVDAPAEPMTWAVAPGSVLGFSTTWAGSAIEGRFARWTADIAFSPRALDRSRVKVIVDLASVASGDTQRDASLTGADWFDAANHPKAVFTARKFEQTGPDRFVAHGTLSLRGADKPQDVAFRLQIDGDKARARGVTSLDRTAFGVGQGEWASTDQIPAKVSISLDIKATRR